MEVRSFVSEHSRDLFALSIIALLIIGAFFPFQKFSNLFFEEEKEFHSGGQVAILDQFHDEKPRFTKRAVELFENKGVEVRVFENITVGLYRKLPTFGYKLIIFRVHTGAFRRTGEGKKPVTSLFTSENYVPSKYPAAQTEGRILPAVIEGHQNKVFAIGPKFVASEMEGRFDNTVLVISSCYVFHPKSRGHLVRGLLERGAKCVVGWQAGVTLNHADRGTYHFLRHFVEDDMALKGSIKRAIGEVGRDPHYKSKLLYYPSGAGSLQFRKVMKK